MLKNFQNQRKQKKKRNKKHKIKEKVLKILIRNKVKENQREQRKYQMMIMTNEFKYQYKLMGEKRIDKYLFNPKDLIGEGSYA